jgi:AraC-like DNA-binding protein
MDPLSDVVSLLKPRGYVTASLEAGGKWSLQFPDHPNAIKFQAVISGQCWLSVEGVSDAVLLKAGDCFLLPKQRSFRLASDMSLTPVDAFTIFSNANARDGVVSYNGGGDFFTVGCLFALAGGPSGILQEVLPPIVHIRRESDQTALRSSLEQMIQEQREREPGCDLLAQHLAHTLLLRALRVHLSQGLNGGVGWLFALADPQIRAAIASMHDDPARKWTLQDLAKRAGMSRSTFALKFKQTVGSSPMEYLTRWRMLLAADRLAHSNDSISMVAPSLGYESESAFSAAFKKIMGCSPRQYSRADNSASASHSERLGAGAGSNLSQAE